LGENDVLALLYSVKIRGLYYGLYYAVAPPNEIEYLYALSLQYFLVCHSYSSFSRLFMLLSQINNYQ